MDEGNSLNIIRAFNLNHEMPNIIFIKLGGIRIFVYLRHYCEKVVRY